MKEAHLYDLAIVGGGPAGISAAVEAYRFALKTVLIERAFLGGCLRLARMVDNYPPWSAVKGLFLAGLFKKRFLETGLPLIWDEVTALKLSNRGPRYFRLKLSKNSELRSRAVILATGQEFFIPRDLRFLKNLSCFPDGIEPKKIKRGQKVAVVGGGEVALDQALLLKDYGACVTVLVRSYPKANKELLDELFQNQIKMFLGVRPVSARLEVSKKIILEWESCRGHKQAREFDLIMVACGKKPEYPKLHSIRVERLFHARGRLSVDSLVPGLFLAGDLKNGRRRYLSLAVADGIRAAQRAAEYLNSLHRD